MDTTPSVVIVGGGPAGLMAAEWLSTHGCQVDLYDAMPSVGRKFLLAGRGGLNLTHAEPYAAFATRFAERQPALMPALDAFTPDDLCQWAQDLGISTFVGSSGRVFPTDMKAAPLLRAWLHRLRVAGVRFHMRHRWLGWTESGQLRFDSPQGEVVVAAPATVLALGGASWSRLGSDGAWVAPLQAVGADVAPLQAANCGFNVQPTGPDRTGWSEHLQAKQAGQPIKPVAMTFVDANGQSHRQRGEFVLTITGIEGSLVYSFASRIREQINAQGHSTVYLDLLPSHSAEQVLKETQRPRGPRSLSTHLKSCLGLHGVKMALLHELLTPEELGSSVLLAERIKALPITLASPRPVDEAISTAGGVRFESLTPDLMLSSRSGVFCAGEMLDWEAPTGGYLLTASMATGKQAAQGVLNWLKKPGS